MTNHLMIRYILLPVLLACTLSQEAHSQTMPTTAVTIERIIPGPDSALCEWRWTGQNPSVDSQIAIEWKRRDGDWSYAGSIALAPGQTSACIDGLVGGVDYEVRLRSIAEGGSVSLSATRLVRPGIVPGVVIDYLHPDDETYADAGRYIGSPSLAVLPGGEYVASHDIFGPKVVNDLTRVFISRDRGETWQFLSEVRPSFWGKLFVHRGRLYLLTITREYGDLVIFDSADGGRTWSAPVKLHDAPCHKAPMPVIEHDGRLWTAFETHPAGGWASYKSHVLSAPADADLMDPASWTATPGLPIDRDWPGMLPGVPDPGFIEGNIVVTPEGNLVNVMRYNTEPQWGKAVILNIDAGDPAAPETFGRVIDLNGGMTKFCVHRDTASGRYLSLVNRVTRGVAFQRNLLSLVSSPDLVNWEVEGDLIDYSNGDRYTADMRQMVIGFQYVDWQFDGDDIIAVSRTAINGAHNFHDANHMTFHRFANPYASGDDQKTKKE